MQPFSPPRLGEVLQRLRPVARFRIAFSGGLDSTVLLHAVAALRATWPGVDVRAVHIDHGLHPRSSDWARHCAAQAARLSLDCDVIAVHVARTAGASLEAQARDARYAALAAAMAPGDCLLTAHHADDQAETLMLQLLRGAGVRGLAAMPFRTQFAGGVLARPLLEFTRAELAAWARAQGLTWIDDPANEHSGFNRNFLRQRVMPVLRERWPAVARTLARSAAHCADAAQRLDELAALDLRDAAAADGSVHIDRCLALPAPRQRHLLRYWLRARDLPLPNAARLDQLLQQARAADGDRYPRTTWPGAEVRRYRGRLYAMRPLPPHDASRQLTWDLVAPLPLPWLGRQLSARFERGVGLSEHRCRAGALTVRFRRGGESCRVAGQAHHKSLKQLFQEHGVPAWQRDRVPLIYIDDALAAAVDHWVCAPFAAAPDELGVQVVTVNLDLRNSG